MNNISIINKIFLTIHETEHQLTPEEAETLYEKLGSVLKKTDLPEQKSNLEKTEVERLGDLKEHIKLIEKANRLRPTVPLDPNKPHYISEPWQPPKFTPTCD